MVLEKVSCSAFVTIAKSRGHWGLQTSLVFYYDYWLKHIILHLPLLFIITQVITYLQQYSTRTSQTVISDNVTVIPKSWHGKTWTFIFMFDYYYLCYKEWYCYVHVTAISHRLASHRLNCDITLILLFQFYSDWHFAQEFSFVFHLWM